MSTALDCQLFWPTNVIDDYEEFIPHRLLAFELANKSSPLKIQMQTEDMKIGKPAARLLQ